MRILIANWHRAVVGGAESYLRCLWPELRARGHQIALLHELDASPGQSMVDDAAAADPRWNAGPADRDAVLRCVEAWAPQVVYLHGLLDPSLEATLVTRFPTVLFAHNYYGTCISGSKSHAFPARRPCERTFGPLCLLLHYARRCGGLNPSTTWRQYRLQTDRHVLSTQYRAVVVASAHMRREYHRHGVPVERLHCVPLFPTGTSPDPSRLPSAPRPAGSLPWDDWWKTRAFRCSCPLWPGRGTLGRPLTLSVAGDGPARPQLERLARRLKVPAEFLGWVNASRRNALMRQADLLAAPSIWPEPFGLVGIEAGCVGLPAVAYATGGVPDWLVPGETGECARGGAHRVRPGGRPRPAPCRTRIIGPACGRGRGPNPASLRGRITSICWRACWSRRRMGRRSAAGSRAQ